LRTLLRSLSSLPVAALLLAPAALAAPVAEEAPIAPAFGNTVLATYPDGRTQKIWLHADGTWDGLSRSSAPLSGRWELRGAKVCMRQVRPPTLPISFCTPFPDHAQAGVQWLSHDVAGRPIQLSLQKGMPLQAATPNQSR